MQLSKAKLNKQTEKEMFDIFYQTFGDIKGKNEAKMFLNDFLSKMERIKLAKRLLTALCLEKGKSYDYIKQTVKVSSATIASVDKLMTKNSDGFILAFKNMEANQWASKTAGKINSFIKGILK